MQILIQGLPGEPQRLEIWPMDDIRDVKRKIQELTAIAPPEQNLRCGRKKLRTIKQLSRLQKKKSTVVPIVHVSLNHRGFWRSVCSGFRCVIDAYINTVARENIWPYGFPHSFN
jgi:hypothetical protein